MVFDQILKINSTLLLSDKKEALDVVENKILETLNKVRINTEFQIPIYYQSPSRTSRTIRSTA